MWMIFQNLAYDDESANTSLVQYYESYRDVIRLFSYCFCRQVCLTCIMKTTMGCKTVKSFITVMNTVEEKKPLRSGDLK